MVEPKVIYEDKDFLIVLKPAGLLMHPFRVGTDKGRALVKEATLTNWLRRRYPEVERVGDNTEMRPGLVHRLDRETSGLVIVARNQKAFEHFKKLFQTGGVRKTYLALVVGVPKSRRGRIEKPISLKSGTIKRTVHSGRMTKSAITEYEVVDTFSYQEHPYALLRVHPLTGRTHQIRVHLASLGHPILGDSLYGSHKRKKERLIPIPRLMLHALAVSFTSPSGKGLTIEEAPPPDFEEVRRVLEDGET